MVDDYAQDAGARPRRWTRSSRGAKAEDGKKKDRAKKVGAAIAKRPREGDRQVVFDRDGFIYHGRVSALADGAREGGLKF